MTPKHSVVFLTYNRADLIGTRLAEVDINLESPHGFELIVCDNGSASPAVKSLLRLHGADDLPYPYTVVEIEHNRGFGNGFNRATSHASGEILHLISNDVQIYGNFLPRVAAALDEMPGGLVAKRLITGHAGWNEFGERIIRYPEGYYLAVKRETWDRLGGFDERFLPYDYEDVDLGYRCDAEGIPMIEIRDLPMLHNPAGTIGYTPERRDHTNKMRRIFAEKWGLELRPEVL